MNEQGITRICSSLNEPLPLVTHVNMTKRGVPAFLVIEFSTNAHEIQTLYEKHIKTHSTTTAALGSERISSHTTYHNRVQYGPTVLRLADTFSISRFESAAVRRQRSDGVQVILHGSILYSILLYLFCFCQLFNIYSFKSTGMSTSCRIT